MFTEKQILDWAANATGAPSPYYVTHARRFAETLNDLTAIKATYDCILDLAGTTATRDMLSAFISAQKVLLMNSIDVEIDEWAIRENQPDLIVFTEVVEHLSADSAHAIHQICKSLAIGGHLYLTTVNICRRISLGYILAGEAPYVAGGLFGKRGDRHQREYAPWELAHLVAAQGFEVKLSTYDNYFKTPKQIEGWKRVERNLSSLDMRLHGDTIAIIAKKIEEPKEPFRLYPVYNHRVSNNRAETLPEQFRKRVKLMENGHRLDRL